MKNENNKRKRGFDEVKDLVTLSLGTEFYLLKKEESQFQHTRRFIDSDGNPSSTVYSYSKNILVGRSIYQFKIGRASCRERV